jgi:hypothetical protein
VSDERRAFVSYSRDDSQFALKLAADLRADGASVWIDQLDISPGAHWDRAIQEALNTSPIVLVVLSPSSVESTNVQDEVGFAIEERKTLIPILYRDCVMPMRLRRLQYLDFRHDLEGGFRKLRHALGLQPRAVAPAARPSTQSAELPPTAMPVTPPLTATKERGFPEHPVAETSPTAGRRHLGDRDAELPRPRPKPGEERSSLTTFNTLTKRPAIVLAPLIALFVGVLADWAWRSPEPAPPVGHGQDVTTAARVAPPPESGAAASEAAPAPKEKLVVAGTVVDQATNDAVGQATIAVDGAALSVTSEDSGNFQLVLPDEHRGRVRITATKAGYARIEQSVAPPVHDLILQMTRSK